MKRNQKFVSVKAPLDFFVPKELERLKQYENFYVTPFLYQAVAFQTVARVVKNLLSVQQDNLDPTPFERSYEIFSTVFSLWGKELKIEPFFMSVFSDELCGPLPHESMLEARENAVIQHEHGLLLSGTVIFFLVQMGWHRLEMLQQLRNEIYQRTVQGEEWANPKNEFESIVLSVQRLIFENTAISLEKLSEQNEEWCKKLSTRIQRSVKSRGQPKTESASIYGEKGFAV